MLDPVTGFLIGATVGGLWEAVKLILASKRSEVIPAFKASKEFKQELTQVAKDHGWTLGQTTYIVASMGVKAIRLREEEQQEPNRPAVIERINKRSQRSG